jgi:hypothetical protein
LTRFYADTGMYLAAWLRLAALAWSAVTGVTAVALAFWPSWNIAAALLIAAAQTAAYGWLGFFYLANPEWRPPNGDA